EGSAATALALPPREPLARPAPAFDGARMLADVQWLAADERQGRGVGTEGLTAARDWIAARLGELGLEPGGDDGTFLQAFREAAGPDGGPVLLHNVVGVLRGTNQALAGQSAVLGAHYDHLGRGWPDVREGMAGQIHNGADDNASGIAVLLEVARVLKAQLRPERSVVFVAFSGEEWGRKGSRFYVRAMRQYPATSVIGMLNLDTVGRLGAGQLQVLGCGTATEWPHVVRGIGFTTGVQAQAIAGDPGGSDQQSFVEFGVPAVQLFSGANEDYHRPSDDVAKIDAAGLVTVATFAREAVAYLSERREPLTATIAGQKVGEAPPAAAGRRVSLGTMPDFAFPGPGVKVAQVTEGSAGALAGIVAGDVLLAIDGAEIADLRGYSALLREKAAGAEVRIRLRRGGEEMEVTAKLTAR
ncbi:MAG: M20/M25/M40 family metallo-hydrolase, partial [Planctomycetes bacterium]|nr:M20/M25/M40 family metallo-hydrolase [Planctomycetota bacterium]